MEPFPKEDKGFPVGWEIDPVLCLVLLAILPVLIPLIVLVVLAVEGSTVADDVKLVVRRIDGLTVGLRVFVDPAAAF